MALPKQVLHPELGPLSVIRVLWKGLGWVILITLVVAGFTAAYVQTMPAVYKADALILVGSQKIPEKYVSSSVNDRLSDRLATIQQQILSMTQLRKLIEQFNLYPTERRALAEELVIEKMRADISVEPEKGGNSGQPSGFRVAYRGKNPALVTEVANRLANLFIEENLKSRAQQAEGTSDFIDSQMEESKKKLDELEAKVSQYKLAHNGELPEQETSLLATVGRLQVEMQGNQDATNRAQSGKVILQSALEVANSSLAAQKRLLDDAAHLANAPSVLAGPATAGTVPSNPVASGPRSPRKSELLQQQYFDMLSNYTPKHPTMIALQKNIDRQVELEQQEDRRVAQVANARALAGAKQAADAAAGTSATAVSGPTVANNPVASAQILQEQERIQNLNMQLTLSDRELQRLSAEHDRIVADSNQYQARIERLPIREQEMAAVYRDYAIAKTQYASLLDKKMSAGMATDMERRQQSERFTLIDPARVPEVPVSPNRPLFRAVGGLLGLALGLAFVVGKDVKRNVILGEWEIPGGVPVLGRVPPIVAAPKAVHKRRLWRLAFLSATVIVVAAGILGTFLYRRGA